MRTAVLPGMALLALLCAAAGCSGRPRLGEVKGTVLLKGKPLANVWVEFIPDAPAGPRSTGSTDAKGRYTLVCADGRPGALVGPHRVVLRDLDTLGDKFLGRRAESVERKPSRLPDQYADVARTPLRKEVKAEPQTIDLDVSGP
jgi:hypothetical protein